MLFDQPPDELARVQPQVHPAERQAELEPPLAQRPFGERREVPRGVVREDGVATLEVIDPAVELARPGLGPPVRTLGDRAEDAVLPREEGEDLGRLAVLRLAQTDAAITHEG